MKVNIGRFYETDKLGCLMAEGTIRNTRFGVFVDLLNDEVGILMPSGVDYAEFDRAIGMYADAICDSVALKFEMGG